ncbi:Hypothetical protein NAEGRDRAFT_72470 [Naegleria gruberi]|uniref:F-box domain-containing protein n=1 Tax=Naegleria gruberi TaxID=5762 RepID=D2VTY2_NAEGR|nr:uncharacterized protein NAEGRDRAFT_72470 [Naegleria gruberi]EFC39737.1 Hypothetical protein NAEGRDRAFT_72470 [Naegleria gruberi]|eukprot:XP_002672481.1 Hypothetical protein NAEGRDRAFT_72470 [Naegleria gruberi strain NEG-M]
MQPLDHTLSLTGFAILIVLLVIVWILVRKRVRNYCNNHPSRKEFKVYLPFCSDELALIISFLEKSDIGNLSLVCREAKQATYSSTVWNELCGTVSLRRVEGLLNLERYEGKIKNLKLITDQDEYFDDDFICRIFERLNERFQIRKMTIEVSTLELFKFNLLNHLDCLECLEHLKILDNSTISILFNNSLMPIRLPKKLESIKVRGFSRVANRSYVFDTIFIQTENIKIVKFENNQGFNEIKFQSPKVDLKHLTSISLSWTSNISTEYFNNLMGKCKNLKKLDLSGSTFVANNLNIPTTIEVLDISSCLFDDTTLTMIACLPYLKFVNLSSTLIPLDILILYCQVGRCVICQIGSKEELQILKSNKHIRLSRISPLDFDSKIKEIKKSTSVESNICKMYYQQVFTDPIEPPKLTLKPTKLYKAKLVKFSASKDIEIDNGN